MANRRMFSLKIIDSARFLKMPSSSQLLYFHLSLRADDDGVVEGYNVIRMLGCSEDDLKILVAKGFIVVLNDDLVSFITDWKEHNLIRADRKIDSIYRDLLLRVVSDVKLLESRPRTDLKGKKIVEDIEGGRPVDDQWTDEGQPMDEDGQHRIGKDRLGEDSIGKVINISKDIYVKIIDLWNSLNLSQIKFIQGTREKLLKSRLKEYGEESVFKAIDNIGNSSFLKGQNDTGWTITFDWFVKPNNFIKVLEGNYLNKEIKNEGYGKNTKKQNRQKGNFNNYEQREYDYESVERKLLGWED